MGAKQRFVGTNAKNMGANAAIVTFAPTIPCFAQRNLYRKRGILEEYESTLSVKNTLRNETLIELL